MYNIFIEELLLYYTLLIGEMLRYKCLRNFEYMFILVFETKRFYSTCSVWSTPIRLFIILQI